MIQLLLFFAVLLQIVALLTTAATVYVFGVRRDDTAEPYFFIKQNGMCKIATMCLFGIGWWLGDPLAMGIFPGAFACIGIGWFIMGIACMMVLLYGLFTKMTKPSLEQLRRFGIGDIIFGITLTVLCWLFWG